MTIRITFQGAYAISDYTNQGYCLEKQYMGYTKQEAIKKFKEALRQENNLEDELSLTL